MNLSILFQFWVVMVAGRINEYQQAIIAYKDEMSRCSPPPSTASSRPQVSPARNCRHASPNLNAYAERFVRSIKEECLNRMIFFGEKQLRYAASLTSIITTPSAPIKGSATR